MACHIEPKDKKKYISDVGQGLVKRHGKKKYYTPKQVQTVSRELGYRVDWECWAYCFFVTPEDFRIFHEGIGEICDYASMKAMVVAEVVGNAAPEWFQVDLSWIEWPDIDLSAIFDWFDLS